MKIEKITFPAVSFKKIESPYEKFGQKEFVMVVNIKRLPKELENWRGVNPRDPKVKSTVSNEIRNTLEDNPMSFFFKNRGLTILANRINFDTKKGEVVLEMTDFKLHGLLDGGHSFKVIQEYLSENLKVSDFKEKDECFIKIEALEGFRDLDSVVDLVEARNTSSQVKGVSILELKDYFKEIKMQLENERYSSDIFYKEYELDTLGNKKLIPIQDIISYLVCFDIESFPRSESPVFTYSGKTATLNYFEKNRDRLMKYVTLLPQILKLHDTIYIEFPKELKRKIIKLSGIKERKEIPLFFIGENSEYRIPNGYIYPILSAFRDLVVCKKDVCSFEKDPFKLFDDIKHELIGKVAKAAKDSDSSNKVGKDSILWDSCADLVHYEK